MKACIGFLSILGLALGLVLTPGCNKPATQTTSATAPPVKGDGAAPLELKLTGFENSQGRVRVAIVNSREAFETGRPRYLGLSLPIINNAVTHVVSLPPGEYALKVFHDENGNEVLDTHMFGIPSEGYGFSNNARGKFGPPAWEEARFVLTREGQIQQIRIQ